MKYQMPEPFRKQGQQLCNDGNTTVFFDAYTAAQMHEAFNAGRAAGIEEAIKAVDDIESQTYTFAGETFDDAGKSLMLAADAIRNLKKTPCA